MSRKPDYSSILEKISARTRGTAIAFVCRRTVSRESLARSTTRRVGYGGCEFEKRMRSRWRLNVSSRSPPRDLWSEVTGGVYCAASVTLLWLCSLAPSTLLHPLLSFHLSLSLSFSVLFLFPRSDLLSLSLSLSLWSVCSRFIFPRISSPSLFPVPLVRSFVRSLVARASQVRASPPSYIQQTPSIYSFELDGSKGKVAGCCSVNFRPLKYLVSSRSLSVRLPILCSFALIYRSPTGNEKQ